MQFIQVLAHAIYPGRVLVFMSQVVGLQILIFGRQCWNPIYEKPYSVGVGREKQNSSSA